MSEKCGSPHPDNDHPGAFYRDRFGAMHDTKVPGGMFCDRPTGHDGHHGCLRKYLGVIEQQEWPAIPNADGSVEWSASLSLDLEIDHEATMQSTGTSSIYRLKMP